MAIDRTLVNFFYAHPVGHVVEALHYCLGHHAADPDREIAVTLNAASPVELADFCPFVSAVYPVDHPFVQPCTDSVARLARLPREWDWVLDDFRRHQDIQLFLFPGLRDYYAAADRHLHARQGHTVVGAGAAGYLAHQQLRFTLPPRARAAVRHRLGDADAPGRPRIAVMPAGSSDASLYPSPNSWHLILDALTDAFPGVQIVFVGRLTQDDRTATSLAPADLAGLLAHRSCPVNCFDVALAEQLAVVEACDLFLAPHTGFGLAALAIGTPWLAISGGRWFEYFFNRVPFRSILPDPERFPSFSQFDPAITVVDGEEGPRTPSMSRARIQQDLERIIIAAGELISGSLTYEQSLQDYFPALLTACHGDLSAIWSIDGIHLSYL
ncbi:MAG: glycosyltransferase family 9 protein [Pseudonocardiaceae bacterium]